MSFLGHDPLSGSLFVFRNKGGHLVKILWWDRDGLAIYYKRLERGEFLLPAREEAGRRDHQRATAETACRVLTSSAAMCVKIFIRNCDCAIVYARYNGSHDAAIDELPDDVDALKRISSSTSATEARSNASRREQLAADRRSR